MKQKRKNNSSKDRLFVTRFVRLFIGLCLGILIFAGVCLSWAYGGYVKPSLDREYIEEAKHLYENPQDGYVGTDFENDNWQHWYIQLQPQCSDFDSKLCFSVIHINETNLENLRWTELIINKQLVRRSLEDWRYSHVVTPTDMLTYISGSLDKGYHIIEFRVKESPFAEPYIIQKSAILIE